MREIYQEAISKSGKHNGKSTRDSETESDPERFWKVESKYILRGWTWGLRERKDCHLG